MQTVKRMSVVEGERVANRKASVAEMKAEINAMKSTDPDRDVFGSKKGCLCNRTGYFKYFSGAWMYYRLLDGLEDYEELYDKLVNEWTTVGVIGALLLSITYGPYVQPDANLFGICSNQSFSNQAACTKPNEWLTASDTELIVINMLNGFCVGFPSACVVLSTVYFVAINQIDKKMTPRFVEEMAHILMMPLATLVLCMVVILCYMLAMTYYLYFKAHVYLYVAIAVSGVIGVPLFGYTYWVIHGTNGIVMTSVAQVRESKASLAAGGLELQPTANAERSSQNPEF
mmetsp:Transcript_38232/g.75268  ORF Transcript_38232/g.75268 Transcript_38232/m.75268 type:complete len:286 (+) Transcript_38232:34-891(+)|eukprot:CAMPEP_0175098722 /NCGR_PEP_ID=MMETSP0086_2-20121207/6027_1 /TAXON_ID=136419 /ORGANISM="Unknown Unknown, Strain D1" /LENGTH=285 /DNA_ID=CAMNT_0016372429 /DNA_START=31 /DNA_END=888 /DNA_ORIENTATION=+